MSAGIRFDSLWNSTGAASLDPYFDIYSIDQASHPKRRDKGQVGRFDLYGRRAIATPDCFNEYAG
jgi:hypothetical protein